MRYLLISLFAFSCQLSAISQCPSGLKFDLREHENQPRLVAVYPNTLPAKISLKKYCPKPTTQLSFKTSAGWASAYYGMTILEARKRGLSDINDITQNSFAPVFAYTSPTNNNCVTEASLVSILDVLKTKGTPKFMDYPYYCPQNDWPPRDTELTKLGGYVKIFDKGDAKVDAIKKALASGNPVVVGLRAPPTFCNAEQAWRPYEEFSDSYDGQAVCIVGYDDNLIGGSIEIVNSWGSRWGNNGFTRIRYTDLDPWVFSGYQLFIPETSVDREASINGRLSNGSPMEVELMQNNVYKFKKSYSSGTEFSFDAITNFSGYLYITYQSNKDEYVQLFPGVSESAALPFVVNKLLFPSEGKNIQLDNNSGSETICFIVSQVELSAEVLEKYTRQNELTGSENLFEPHFMKVTSKGVSNEPIVVKVLLDHI